jgi:poly(A) polymerase
MGIERLTSPADSGEMFWTEKNDLLESMRTLDSHIEDEKENPQGRLLASLARPFITFEADKAEEITYFKETCKQLKRVIYPLTPPNVDVEKAVKRIFREWGIDPPRPPRRKKRK